MKEALKLALEALEDFADVIKYDNEQDDIGSKACCGVLSYHPHSESCKAKQAITTIKAALAQPPQRTWVGLTDEEIGECFEATFSYGMSMNDIPQIIEAKLKAKNGFPQEELNA